jgi:hypothetical protein
VAATASFGGSHGHFVGWHTQTPSSRGPSLRHPKGAVCTRAVAVGPTGQGGVIRAQLPLFVRGRGFREPSMCPVMEAGTLSSCGSPYCQAPLRWQSLLPGPNHGGPYCPG